MDLNWLKYTVGVLNGLDDFLKIFLKVSPEDIHEDFLWRLFLYFPYFGIKTRLHTEDYPEVS